MQAFFYSTYRKLEDSGFLKEYWSEIIDKVPGYLQIFHNEDHLSFHEVGGEFLANCGVLAFEDKFNKSVLEEIFYKDGRDLEWYLKRRRTHGQFFLLSYMWNKTDYKKELKLITDQFATIPIYIKYCEDGDYEVSNVYRWLIDKKVGDIDLFALDQRLSVDWNYPMFTDNTLFRNIKLAKSSIIYKLDKRVIIEENYTKENYITLDETIKNNFKFLDNVDRIWCDVTGGFDTRLNLDYCLKNFVFDYNGNSKVIFGNDLSDKDKWLLKGKYSDHNICKQIERKFGIDIEDYTSNHHLVIDDWLEKHFNDMLKFNDNPVMSDKRFYHHWDIAHRVDIKLTGFAGTEMCTNSGFDLQETNTWMDYVRIRQPHRDLLKLDYSNSYYWNMSKYSQDNNTGDGEPYSFWLTGFQNCQQSYWGTANLFLPIYSPYIDLLPILLKYNRETKKNYKIQRYYYDDYMLQELSSINTSHGFPACEVTWKNWYRFIRLFISFGDYNLQYINLWKRFRRYIIDKLFYNFPHSKVLRFIGKKMGRDMSFVDRGLLNGGLSIFIDEEKFRKVKIYRQPLLWIYKLDRIMKEYMDKKV
uniref:Uncharacterized protein n=1 Tax=viral metagenome TaxID=1070528 RepID=A0A6M3ISZ1_9ZZZZ